MHMLQDRRYPISSVRVTAVVQSMMVVNRGTRLINYVISHGDDFSAPVPVLQTVQSFVEWDIFPKRLTYHGVGIMEKAVPELCLAFCTKCGPQIPFIDRITVWEGLLPAVDSRNLRVLEWGAQALEPLVVHRYAMA